MLDNKADEREDMELDSAETVVESPEEALPVPSPPTASSRLSLPREDMFNESHIIARFLTGAGLGAAKISGDFTAMADALAYRLASVNAPNDGEESNL